jgi:uncharacterized protein
MKNLLFLIILINSCSQKSNDNNYLGNDVRLYENTEAYPIACAIEKEDVITIKKILKEKPKEFVDFQEKTYGESLLYFAVYSGKIASVRALAEMGANPKLTRYRSWCNCFYSCMQYL